MVCHTSYNKYLQKMVDDRTTVTGFVFTFVLVSVLQGAGCFSSHWVSSDRCEYVGLFANCCLEHCNASYTSLEGPRYLSVQSPGLQLFSFAVYVGACIFMWWTIFRGDDGDDGDDDDDGSLTACCCCLCCCFILYPIAGITSMVGCILVAQSDLPDYSSLGYSLYLCLFASVYVIFQVVALCFYQCFCGTKGSRDTQPPTTTVATTSASGQMTPVQSKCTVSVAEYEEVHESGGIVFVRRLNIRRVSAYFR